MKRPIMGEQSFEVHDREHLDERCNVDDIIEQDEFDKMAHGAPPPGLAD